MRRAIMSMVPAHNQAHVVTNGVYAGSGCRRGRV